MKYASDDEVPDCVSEDDASESEDEWDSENEDLAPETMAAVMVLSLRLPLKGRVSLVVCGTNFDKTLRLS